jgi:hypothetical protein
MHEISEYCASQTQGLSRYGHASGDSLASFMTRNGGFALSLTAFFDETQSHNDDPLTGVAGFLYDRNGIAEFEAKWAKRTHGHLTKPFHTYDCFWGYDDFKGWPEPVRHLLMHDLAEIIERTRIAALVAYTYHNEYEEWAADHRRAAHMVGSPYTACLLSCVDLAAAFAKTKALEGDLIYIFESGAEHQAEANRFMQTVAKRPKIREALRYGGHAFSPKHKEPLLCAADFLAWEWQRNLGEAAKDDAKGVEGFFRSELCHERPSRGCRGCP